MREISTEALDAWERRMELMPIVSPHLLLVISAILSAVFKPLPPPLTALMLGFTVLAAAWIIVDWQLRWSAKPLGRVAFFLGLLAVSTALVWLSPWYVIFIIVVYGYAFENFSLRWAVIACWAVATVHARALVGAWPTTLPSLLVFLLLAVAITVMATSFSFLGSVTAAQARQRKEMIGKLLESNRKLSESMAENAALQERLVEQAEKEGVIAERQRMAREIHDTLAQGLTGIITQLEAAEQSAARPDWSRHVTTATWLARTSLAEARRSVRAIRPEALEKAYLPDAVADTTRQWSRLTGVRAEASTTGTARRLPTDVEVALLRATQECLANVAKHAGASRVGVTLSYMPDVVTLDVRDDGTGFDPHALTKPDPGRGGFGLTAMRQRVESLGGTLVVESEPGAGTAVSASISIEPSEDRGAR